MGQSSGACLNPSLLELNPFLDLQGLHLDLGLRNSYVRLELDASEVGSGELGRETQVSEGEREKGFAETMEYVEP